MNVRNCRKCGRMFNYISGLPLCQACKDAMEAKFQQVKEYIRDNKGVGIREVAEACEVEPQQINQWLREDRLELADDSAIMLNCESCGAPIRSGKYCDKCRNSMASSFGSAARDISARAAMQNASAHSGAGFRINK